MGDRAGPFNAEPDDEGPASAATSGGRSALERSAIDPSRDVGSRQSRRRLAGALGIAATVTLGMIIGAALVTRPPDPAPTAEPRAVASGAPEPATDADAATDGSVTAESATRLGDLGVVESGGALRHAIARRLEAGDGTAFDSPAALPCVVDGAAAAGLVVVSALGTATLDGIPVVVLVGPSGSGAALGVALDGSTCAVLETVTLVA